MDTQLSFGRLGFFIFRMKQIIKQLALKSEPEQVFAGIQGRGPCFWLDSSLLDERSGTWSYLGFEPFLKIRFRSGEFLIEGKSQERFRSLRPLSVLREYLSAFETRRDDPDFPFLGGGVGYFGYELGNYLEKIPFRRTDDLNLPELAFDLYQFVLGFHHPSGTWYLLGIEDDGLPLRNDLYLDNFSRMAGQAGENPEQGVFSERVASDFSKEQYFSALLQAKEYIRNGDIYQVNLTQRFCSEYPGGVEGLYRRLRRINPGAYAGVLRYPDFSILSSSPELYLRARGREVITRPIKGTRPRGKTREEDEQLKSGLLRSEKDLAELTMIVDLERNDLGRVCDYGSVTVSGYPELETYSRVHHLTATISGKLAQGKNIYDLIRASFPGGSITGAPKVRAMEIIDGLEPHARGPYTGSIGWIGFNGNMELNIAIRIIILKDQSAYFPAGGGIVADSDPELEYQESWIKALALWEALSGT